jgi:hypothetical protein
VTGRHRVRINLELTKRQLAGIQKLSAATGESTDALISTGIDNLLAARGVTAEERTKRAIRAAGSFASGRSDVSANHDRYLAEAARQ